MRPHAHTAGPVEVVEAGAEAVELEGTAGEVSANGGGGGGGGGGEARVRSSDGNGSGSGNGARKEMDVWRWETGGMASQVV